MSFSQFAKCRPLAVKVMSSASMNMCLCEYCTNVLLKINALKKAYPPLPLSGEIGAVEATVCSLKSRTCTHRECANCGVDNFPDIPLDKQLTWHKWEMKELSHKGKQMKRKVLSTKLSHAKDLVAELKTELRFLSEHIYRARYQQEVYRKCRQAASSPGVATLVLDFAENFACVYNNEVQSAHWHHQQVTIHPMVVSYQCHNCQDLVTESIVAISDDPVHDFHAVHEITRCCMSHLKTNRNLHLKMVHMWSDGCAAQYKSKGPFADLARFQKNFGVSIRRHYFGSRHGKGASDGESAVVKSAATRAIKSNQVIIASALDFFTFCQQFLTLDNNQAECKHFLRTFMFIPSENINRTRLLEPMPLKGSQKVHCIEADVDGTLRAKYLSCCCFGNCTAECEEAVGSWKIFKPKSTETDPLLDVDMEENSSINSPTDRIVSMDGIMLEASTSGLCVDEEPAVNIPIRNTDATCGMEADPQACASGDQEEINISEPLKCGMWVMAVFPGKRKTTKYLGMILQLDGSEAQVKFARQSNGHFTWPTVDDIGWMPSYALVPIDTPTLDPRERMILSEKAKHAFGF